MGRTPGVRQAQKKIFKITLITLLRGYHWGAARQGDLLISFEPRLLGVRSFFLCVALTHFQG
jgi:hypothetical protein